jgi:hypothetical protein
MGPYREALRDLGNIEGRNVQIEIRRRKDSPAASPSWLRNWSIAR